MRNKDLLQFTNSSPAHSHRAYVNSAVRFHHRFTREERLRICKQIGWNVFKFPAEMTIGDFLSDSGTTTPTIEQLSASLLGDEAYGTNWGYIQLLKQFENVFGIEFSEYKRTLLVQKKKKTRSDQSEWEPYLFHQCRAGEHALFAQIGRGRTGLIIPSNGHFDTTHANIEANGITALDIPVQSENFIEGSLEYRFKGNMDLVALEELLSEQGDRIPLVYCTITNNTNAGQPVSLANMRGVKKLCERYQKPFFLDVCRFAENSWYIKHYEPGYVNKPIKEIVHEVFSLCDGFTISLKKDGLSNMGGALCIKKRSALFKNYPEILRDLRVHQITTEGHDTYGGISGRDIMIIASGLPVVITEEYLNDRIGQVRKLGEYMDSLGLPVVKPFGGHAVYLDVDKFYEGTRMHREDFGGIALTGLLLLDGPRACELGAFAFGHYDKPTDTEILPPFNYVRIAIPRMKYEEPDLLFTADCIKHLHNMREDIPRAVPVYGRDIPLRHFSAQFELVKRR